MRASALLLSAMLAACGCAGSGDPVAPPATGEMESAVPYPDLGAFDGEVRSQLERGRSELEAARGRSDIGALELGLAHGRTAMLFHAYSLREAAEACYRNARALDPVEFRWAYLLGLLLHDAGDADSAVLQLERALEIRPDYVPALIALGEVQYELNRLEAAEAQFARSNEIGGRSAAALLGLGRVASSRRDYARAVELLEAALELAPGATEIHYPLGVAYRGMGESAAAEQWLSRRGNVRAEIADPVMNEVRVLARGVQLYLNRGSGYFQQRQYESARTEFERAVAARPDDASAHANLGVTLAMLGEEELSRDELNAAVELDATNVLANYNLATLLAARGEDEAAVLHFEAALREKPDHLQARLNLANSLRRLGRFDAALPHYRAVVEGDPGNRDARLTESLTLIRLHRYAEARRRLEQSRGAFPDDMAIQNALARILAAAPDEASRDRDRAVEIGRRIATEPISLDSAVTLAMVAAENGEFGPALQLQRQAIEWARRLGHSATVRALEADLERYEQRRPSRMPWPDDDPVVSPPPLGSER